MPPAASRCGSHLPQIANKGVVLDTPSYFANVSLHVLAPTGGEPLNAVRSYVRWHAIRAVSAGLNKEVVDESFSFFGRTLHGQRQQQPRWKTCASATDSRLGELLGRYFMAAKFSPQAATRARELITLVEQAFLKSPLHDAQWMDASTRAAAADKLAHMLNLVGGPDKFRDLSALELRDDEWFDNLAAAAELQAEEELGRLGKPVDRRMWEMSASTVNAYNDLSRNVIVFPAGILQPPFFNADYPMSVNFGGIGLVMGHELTHGFDDQGRQYDAAGNLRGWWPAAVVSQYEKRAKCMETQYSQYDVGGGARDTRARACRRAHQPGLRCR